MKPNRTIFWLIEASGGGYAFPIEGLPADMPVRKLLESILGNYPEDLHTRDIDKYSLFDWDCVPLAEDALIGSIPMPGVVNLVLNVSPDSMTNRDSHERHMAALGAKAGTRQVSGLSGFLSSPDARYEPLGTYKFDVFISYASEDDNLASELLELLRNKGLSCFLAAKELRAGTVWLDKIRAALRSCRVVIVLLTPSSCSSAWVMSEAGAAWGLGKPLVPVTKGRSPADLPELVTQYQIKSLETEADRDKMLAEIESLCRG
jgi:hypothetical protein